MGKLRTGTKSDLVGCLEDLVPTQDLSRTPVVQVILLDGAAIVNTLRLGFADIFRLRDPSVPAVHHIATATHEQTRCCVG